MFSRRSRADTFCHKDGSIAVLAIPFQLTEDGSTTELLTNVIKNINDIQEPGTVTKTGPLDFGPVVEALQTKKLFQYTGSLTTPRKSLCLVAATIAR